MCVADLRPWPSHPSRRRIDPDRPFDNVVGRPTHPHEDGCMQSADASSDPALQLLVLERRDDSWNMARYYVLSIEPTLFGESALVREWGRIGSHGRRLGNPYTTQ